METEKSFLGRQSRHVFVLGGRFAVASEIQLRRSSGAITWDLAGPSVPAAAGPGWSGRAAAPLHRTLERVCDG